MGTLKNLYGKEAIDKMKTLAEDIRICMFCTETPKLPFGTRPMGTQEVDEHGNFWFFSGRGSHKNEEIKQDDTVQLIYADAGKSEFMSVTGTADVYNDRGKIDELWNGMMKAWFEEGKNDPELTLLRVRPTEAYYWDTKDGKIASMIKIALSAATGIDMDGGVEGKATI